MVPAEEYIKIRPIKNKIIGMTLSEAETFIKNNNIYFSKYKILRIRVIHKDGVLIDGRQHLDLNSFCVDIEDNKITGVSCG